MADEAAETVLTTNTGDTEQADLIADSLPTAHNTFDVSAQHHRTLPHRMRSLTPSQWWHHAPWPTVRHHREIAYPGADDVSPTGRTLLTQFCVSLR